MKSKAMSILFCLAILCVLVLFSGCSGSGSAGVNCPGEVVAVEGSDKYVLLKHCSGKLYVVSLQNKVAYEVGGLPAVDD